MKIWTLSTVTMFSMILIETPVRKGFHGANIEKYLLILHNHSMEIHLFRRLTVPHQELSIWSFICDTLYIVIKTMNLETLSCIQD